MEQQTLIIQQSSQLPFCGMIRPLFHVISIGLCVSLDPTSSPVNDSIDGKPSLPLECQKGVYSVEYPNHSTSLYPSNSCTARAEYSAILSYKDVSGVIKTTHHSSPCARQFSDIPKAPNPSSFINPIHSQNPCCMPCRLLILTTPDPDPCRLPRMPPPHMNGVSSINVVVSPISFIIVSQ